jgi:hypothetical protein
VWLNLLCLDAPLVAVSWHWLFAQNLGIPLSGGGTCALLLTAWLIYLADRFGDSRSLDAAAPTSLRQRFCLRHRVAWIVGVGLIAAADLFVICMWLNARQLVAGAGVGVCALAYLIVNQVASSVWRVLPGKEISIGFLFAAGTMVPMGARLTSAIAPGWFLFACLCSLNCICIAVWERDIDAGQQRISIATVFPNVRGALLPLLLLGLASLACGLCATGAWSVYICVAASTGMLSLVHVFRHNVPPDSRTALADLVLLSPVVFLLLR